MKSVLQNVAINSILNITAHFLDWKKEEFTFCPVSKVHNKRQQKMCCSRAEKQNKNHLNNKMVDHW